MTPWTEAAAKVWEDFCRRTRENLRDSGADADEVTSAPMLRARSEVTVSRRTEAATLSLIATARDRHISCTRRCGRPRR